MRIDQGFANMTGWKELAAKTREAYNQIPDDEKQSTLLFCDNYGFAGAINYYNRGKVPEAYSLSTDYIFWIPRYPVIRNIIWIGPEPGYIFSASRKQMLHPCFIK